MKINRLLLLLDAPEPAVPTPAWRRPARGNTNGPIVWAMADCGGPALWIKSRVPQGGDPPGYEARFEDAGWVDKKPSPHRQAIQVAACQWIDDGLHTAVCDCRLEKTNYFLRLLANSATSKRR